MLPVHLIDTPRRTALTAHSTALRRKLKEWEKSFAASHSSQKPGKEDIRACVEISKTYKEYKIVRDVLAGKLGVDSLEDAVRLSPTARKGGSEIHYARGQNSETEAWGGTLYPFPHHKGKGSPCQKRNAQHLNLLDPYDPPASASPRPHLITSIGPTPQRDGKMLGLFDLLSNSGGSLQATPSTKKRKYDSQAGNFQSVARVDNEWVVAQTPSRKRIKNRDADGDVLDHLSSNTPEGYRRHCRTPASEGKKFMLSQFFATPSSMHLAAVAEDADYLYHDEHAQQTSLRAFVLGNQASATVETQAPALDATPAYLKRSSSFKDRLLSISGSTVGVINLSKANSTRPSEIQTGPPTLRRYKSAPKPLSEILRGLRKIEDERHEDDLDALREIDGGQINVHVKDSQAGASGSGAGVEGVGLGQEVEMGRENKALTKVWKKKGQKRTTKRVNMRPVKMKPKQENRWVAEDSESEEADRPGTTEEKFEMMVALRDGEDDFLDNDIPITIGREVESIGQDNGLDRQTERISDAEFKDGSDWDGLDDCQEEARSKGRDEITRNNYSQAEAPTLSRNEEKKKKKDVAQKLKQKKGLTINPNAVSHQNFRALKIRNRNSKAKGGRGRFGRKGR